MSERTRKGDGLQRPVIISFAAHVLAVVIVLFAPSSWLDGAESEPAFMSIRLGGLDSPGEGGLTPLGGRPIQEVISLPEARRPQWVQPPADIAPRVIVPIEDTPGNERESELRMSPEEARGRQLTRGAQLLDGTALSDTGANGLGVGLSAGGLNGSGAKLSLRDFCCPEYLATMISLIRERWDSNQQMPGTVVIKFDIGRDGRLGGVEIDRSSGQMALDQSARRAILLTRQLPPIPTLFAEDALTVRLTFEYRR